MSIGILIAVHDGIVLAADSASSLTLMPENGKPNQSATLNVYNNANKIANLVKGLPIGAVAFGSGSIGNASISTLLKDFRASLTSGLVPTFNPHDYTIEAVATALTDFLISHVKAVPTNEPKATLGLLLGGYSSRASLAEAWQINIENGEGKPPHRLREPHEAGITWGGQGEVISRLVLGYSPVLPVVLGAAINPTPTPLALKQLTNHLTQNLQAPIVFAPMPIKDTIDLAEFLVHTSIMFSRFTPGPSAVGGPIEIAAITKHEGFKWIRRKHYFSKEFNVESPREH